MTEYNPFGKELSKIRKGDLDKLINNEIEEGWYVEYKSNFPSNKKVGHSIAAFANSDGGWFIIGVRANDNNIIESVPGFSLINYRRPRDKIRNIVESNISPIPYFESKLIKLARDKAVLIVWIEKGLETPYVTINGKIYRRVGAGSDPIAETDRYSIQKLFEQSSELKERYERFSRHLFSMSKYQDEQNICFLEAYFYTKPSQHFFFDNFYSKTFFNKLKNTFSAPTTLIAEPMKASFPFNSIYSSFNSYILRYLGEPRNSIDLGFTIEVFESGSAKMLIPLAQHDINTDHNKLPNTLQDSSIYRKFKRIVFENRGGYLRLIDGYNFFCMVAILFNQYYQLLREEKFQKGLLARFRLTNTWRTILYLDDENYLKFLEEHGLPICLKSDVEIPEFTRGNAILIDKLTHPDINLACVLIESLGYPISLFPESLKNLGNYLAKLPKSPKALASLD